MSDFMFGNGDLFTIPQDGSGPLRVGAVQNVSLDFSGDLKELYGRNQLALDSTRGKVKVSGSIGSGSINTNFMNETFFGQNSTTGQLLQARDELAMVPASTAYTITPAHGGAGVFDLDMGVQDAVTGKPFTAVTGSVGAGQYTVSASGVYTFAAADANKPVVLNYLYKDAVNGQTLTIQSQLMGTSPEFRLIVSDQFKGANLLVDLYKIITTKLTLPYKQDDYLIQSVDFSAHTNSAGILGRMSSFAP